MRYFIYLFVALMITIMGVVYQPIIEKPLSFYYDAEVEHTSSHYSYKPGQSGTTFDFYVKREDQGYDKLSIMSSIAIPSIFYFGCLLFLVLIKKLLPSKRNRDERDNFNSSEFEKQKEKKPNKKLGINLGLLMLVILFFAAGRNNMFGLGDTTEKVESQTSTFAPNKIAYAGGDLVWLAEIDKAGNGGILIENESTKSSDSIEIILKTFNLIDSTFSNIESFKITKDHYNIDFFGKESEIWLSARPKVLKSFNAKTKAAIHSSSDDFSSAFPELSSGINNHYRQNILMDVLYFETLDGAKYYYDFKSKSNYDNISKIDGFRQEKFELKKENGDRSQLWFHLNKKEKILFDNDFYINGEIIFEDSSRAVVRHKSDISDKAETKLTCINWSGEQLWTIEQRDLPLLNLGKDPFSFINKTECFAQDDNLTFVFYQKGEATGITSIKSATGEILWSFKSADFRKLYQ